MAFFVGNDLPFVFSVEVFCSFPRRGSLSMDFVFMESEPGFRRFSSIRRLSGGQSTVLIATEFRSIIYKVDVLGFPLYNAVRVFFGILFDCQSTVPFFLFGADCYRIFDYLRS